MSSTEQNGYSRCETVDCDCKKEWFGLIDEEYQVVDNKDGTVSWMCLYSLECEDGIKKRCKLCDLWMLGNGLLMHDNSDTEYCLKCCEQLSDFFVEKMGKDPCLLSKLFQHNPSEKEIREMGYISCPKCGFHHIDKDGHNHDTVRHSLLTDKPIQQWMLKAFLGALSEFMKDTGDKYQLLFRFLNEKWPKWFEKKRQRKRHSDKIDEIIEKEDVLKFIEWLKSE